MSMIYGQLEVSRMGLDLTMFADQGSTPLPSEPWQVGPMDLKVEEVPFNRAPTLNETTTRVGHTCLLATEAEGEYEVDVFVDKDWREHGIATQGMLSVIRYAVQVNPDFAGVRLYAHDDDAAARRFVEKFGTRHGYSETGSQLYIARREKFTAVAPLVAGGEGLVQV